MEGTFFLPVMANDYKKLCGQQIKGSYSGAVDFSGC